MRPKDDTTQSSPDEPLAAPRRLPASNTNVGMVYYLLPADSLPIQSSIIADKLVDDLDFNDKGWDRPTVGRNVSQILVNLNKQGLVASQGGRRDRTWCRVDLGPAKGVPATRGRSSYDIGQNSKAGRVLTCIKRSPVRGCRFSTICEATGFSKSSVKAALRRIRKLMPVLIENRRTPSNALYFPTDAGKEHSFLSRKDFDDFVPVSRYHRNQGDPEGSAGQEEEPDDFGLEDDAASTLKPEDPGGDDGDKDYDPFTVGD